MKKQTVAILLVTIFALADSVYAVQTAPVAGGRGAGMGAGMGMGAGYGMHGYGDCDGTGFGRHWDRLAQALDLTAEQQTKIKALIDEEQTKTAALRQQMFDIRNQWQALTQATTFDEKAVRELAAKKAEISTELMVSRARLQNSIQAQLTPEQKALADKIQPFMRGGRHGHDKGHFRRGDCAYQPADCPRRATTK